jgi:hypothetical protein
LANEIDPEARLRGTELEREYFHRQEDFHKKRMDCVTRFVPGAATKLSLSSEAITELGNQRLNHIETVMPHRRSWQFVREPIG